MKKSAPPRFIGKAIEVEFDQTPALDKKPGCPCAFVWRGETYRVAEQLSEWRDYERRGRMARNMKPDHAAVARRRGSWGVGRDYYRVRTDTGQTFELYYDRAPRGADDRKGAWFLYRELVAEDAGDLEAFKERSTEPNLPFEDGVRDLRKRGKI